MARTTMTSKGQVTIPADIREALKLQAGDQLLLDLTEQGFVASVVRKPTPQSLRGIFAHVARPGVDKETERGAIGTSLAEELGLRDGA